MPQVAGQVGATTLGKEAEREQTKKKKKKKKKKRRRMALD
jgi:hypothetical protein